MKRYESDRFRAKNVRGSGYLFGEKQFLEDIRKEIDEHNERMVERGYKPDQFLIIHEERYRYIDDDGLFLKSETYEQRVEIYPKWDIALD